MPWAPASEQHAIDRVRVLLELASPLSQKFLGRLALILDENRQALGLNPRSEVLTDQVAVVPGPQGPSVQSQRLVGWQFTKTDGATSSPKEYISVNTAGLVYESLEYDNWKTFSDRFSVFSELLVSEIAIVADVRSISIEYYDRFVFQGPISDAAARNLLSNQISSSLTESVLDRAELFHLHRGWFHIRDGFRFLANHNIDAQDEQTPHGDTLRVVSMLSKVDLREPKNSDMDDLIGTLTAMHRLANEIFRNSLSEEMVQKVGMQNG